MTVLHKLLILVFKCTCNSLQVHYICNSDHGKQTLPLFILESDQGGQWRARITQTLHNFLKFVHFREGCDVEPKMGLMELVITGTTWDQQWILVSQQVSQLTICGSDRGQSSQTGEEAFCQLMAIWVKQVVSFPHLTLEISTPSRRPWKVIALS